MPPKQTVDLDLDALAPPNRTVRIHGKVYELPGDMGIGTVVHAMQASRAMRDAATDEVAYENFQELLEIIYDLFRQCDPDFQPIDLALNQILQILGLVLSGVNIDFEAAVKEALVGEADTQTEEKDAEHPPTSRSRGRKGAAQRSPKLSPVSS